MFTRTFAGAEMLGIVESFRLMQHAGKNSFPAKKMVVAEPIVTNILKEQRW